MTKWSVVPGQDSGQFLGSLRLLEKSPRQRSMVLAFYVERAHQAEEDS